MRKTKELLLAGTMVPVLIGSAPGFAAAPPTATPWILAQAAPANEEKKHPEPAQAAPKQAPQEQAPKPAPAAPAAHQAPPAAPKPAAPVAAPPVVHATPPSAAPKPAPEAPRPVAPAPHAEAPRNEPPKAEAPKTAPPKLEATKPQAPAVHPAPPPAAPKPAPEAPRPVAPAPRAEAPRNEPPKAEAPKTASPKLEATKPQAPAVHQAPPQAPPAVAAPTAKPAAPPPVVTQQPSHAAPAEPNTKPPESPAQVPQGAAHPAPVPSGNAPSAAVAHPPEPQSGHPAANTAPAGQPVPRPAAPAATQGGARAPAPGGVAPEQAPPAQQPIHNAPPQQGGNRPVPPVGEAAPGGAVPPGAVPVQPNGGRPTPSAPQGQPAAPQQSGGVSPGANAPGQPPTPRPIPASPAGPPQGQATARPAAAPPPPPPPPAPVAAPAQGAASARQVPEQPAGQAGQSGKQQSGRGDSNGAVLAGAAAGFVGGFLATQGLQRFDQVRAGRQEFTNDGVDIIREPGRTIVRENDRVFIAHDENERFRDLGYDVRSEREGGYDVADYDRPDGSRIFTYTDDQGRLVRRVRQYPDGRTLVLIDNRYTTYDRNFRDDVVELPPAPGDLPPDRYVVDAARADQGLVYETLAAPPVAPLPKRYTLDQIRYSPDLRSRMRSVDLNTITFDTGSWTVSPDQAGRLSAIAAAINVAVRREPREIFMIEGYTDATGNAVDNLSLSDRRAQSVAAILTRDFQVPAENLVTQGYGAQYLKEQTQSASAINRRVGVRRITPLLASQ